MDKITFEKGELLLHLRICYNKVEDPYEVPGPIRSVLDMRLLDLILDSIRTQSDMTWDFLFSTF